MSRKRQGATSLCSELCLLHLKLRSFSRCILEIIEDQMNFYKKELHKLSIGMYLHVLHCTWKLQVWLLRVNIIQHLSGVLHSSHRDNNCYQGPSNSRAKWIIGLRLLLFLVNVFDILSLVDHDNLTKRFHQSTTSVNHCSTQKLL